MSKAVLSIVEVANRLGVSHTTISRVINGRPGVSVELAGELRRRMKEMGYQPRAIRPGPRPRDRAEFVATSKRAIGFVYLGTHHAGAPEGAIHLAISPGVSQAATDAGFDLYFAQVPNFDQMPSWLREGRIAGLLLSGNPADRKLLEFVGGFPSVWLSSHPDSRGGDRVIPGNHAAGTRAAEYLLARGHRRLAYVSPLRGWSVFQSRGDAFGLTGERAGATVERLEADSEERLVIFDLAPRDIEGRLEPLVARLRRDPQRPTGIFLPDVPVVLAFYRCAARCGLGIGRDVDVITFGHHLALAGLTPLPAYMEAFDSLRGRRAVGQLIWRINHPGEERGMEVAIEPRVTAGEIQWPPAG